LLKLFSVRRKKQFLGVIMVTLAGAMAEMIGIGAVIPFLQLIATPDLIAGNPLVLEALRLTGGDEVSDLIVPAAGALVLAAVISAALRMILVWVTFRYVAVLTYDLSLMLLGRMLRQPYEVHLNRNSADLISGIEKVNIIGGSLMATLIQAMSSIIVAITIVGLLFFADPLIALTIGGTMSLVYVLIAIRSRPLMLKLGKKAADSTRARVKVLQEAMGGIRDIILDRSHLAFEWQFAVVDTEYRKATARASFEGHAPRYVVEALAMTLFAGIAVASASAPGGMVGAIPMLGALALGSQRLLPLLQNLNIAWVQYSSTVAHIGDVLALMEEPLLPERSSALGDSRAIGTGIIIRDLTFDYNPDARALAGINLTIPKGSRVGLIGKTGSGKSTLLDVVMGFLPPTSGAILVDGIPLDRDSVPNWQARIAHVPQSIFLTDSSIASNIAFGIPPGAIDMDRVHSAARRAEIHDFIEALPQGYDTPAGERGVRLSGGQRQRIGIARALYKAAAVLILDEATSALDDATEIAVMESIRKLDPDLTMLIIAHRLSTLSICDLVVRLESGRIVQTGSYEEVVTEQARSVTE
jgi:ATP-binding cassette subfamily B protein